MKLNAHFKILLLFFATQFTFSCAHFFSDDEEKDISKIESSAENKDLKDAPLAPIKIVEAPPLKNDPLAKTSASAHVKAAHAEVEKQLSKSENSSNHNTTAISTGGVDPEVAIGWLKNGNIRFVKRKLRADGQSKSDIKKLSTEQNPHTIVLACSDSRVPPEIIFDQKLGELFVVRTAGESLDPNTLGSIEYALSHLGTRHILVLGHTNCGAVKAACNTLNGEDAGSENLNSLVKDIHPRIQEFKGKAPSMGYVDEVWANTEGVANDLGKRSGIIALMLKNKNIAISTAIYNLDTGKVHFK